jgi:hypothetical protein
LYVDIQETAGSLVGFKVYEENQGAFLDDVFLQGARNSSRLAKAS